ncbi:MAG: sigma-70 family RNA polymerase sigma factor [Planctomycetota bacterium]
MKPDGTRLKPEELLEKSAWIRRLAGQLVADPSLSEDVAQQTMLEALRQPAAVLNVRAWLSRLVRNTAWAMARSRSRHRRLEENAPAPEQATPTDELVAEAELQQVIGRAVLDLEEPYRSTVLMRYFRGWSAERIAGHEGVPAATVRSHLKRGLDQLRQRFAADQRSSRSAWLALLVPCSRPEPLALASASGLALGGIVMSLKTFVVGLAATLVVTSAVLYWSGVVRFGEPKPASGSPTLAAAAEVSRAEDEKPGVPADSVNGPSRQEVQQGVEQKVALWRTGVISGMVRDVAGRPLEGMNIELDPFEDSAALLQLREAHEEPFREATRPTMTGADGRFAFPAVPEGAYWRVAASGGDYVRSEDQYVEVRGGGVTEIELTLCLGGTVSGLVVDTSGHPVGGAEVSAYLVAPGESGLDGSFVLRGVPNRLTVLQATKAGLAMAVPQPVARLASGELMEGVRIVMHPDRPIRGVVQTANGIPIEGASLVCKQGPGRNPSYVSHTRSDEWGVFCLAPVPDDGLFLIEVEAYGYRPAVEERVEAGASIEIVLGRAGRIDVLPVTVETGESVRPSHLYLERFYSGEDDTEYQIHAKRFKLDQVDVEADPDRYSVPFEDAGRYRVRVEAPGYAAGWTPTFDLNGGEAVGLVVVSLERGGQVNGVVVRVTEETPVAGVLVTLMTPASKGYASARNIHGVLVRDDYEGKRFTSTAEDGTFSFDGLPNGRYLIRVSGEQIPGEHTGLFELARGAPPVTLRIELPIGGSVTGTLLGQEGKPVPGRAVVAHQMSGIHGWARTNEEGVFTIAPLTPGRYKVEPGDASQDPSSSSSHASFTDDPKGIPGPDPREYAVEVQDGKESRVDLDLRTLSANIAGMVLVNSQPRPELVLRLSFILDPGSDEKKDLMRSTPKAVTDEDGSFRLDRLSPGTYDIRVYGPENRPRLTTRRVQVVGGVDQVVDIHVQTARLRGVVRDGGTGDLLGDVAVMVMRRGDDDERNRLEALTDGDGSFAFDLLLPGDYQVEAQTAWGASPLREIRLMAGDDSPIELAIQPAGAVRARVLPDGWTLGTLMVDLVDRATGLPHLLQQKRVDDDGSLLLLGIRPGEYDLRLTQRLAGRSAAAPITVETGRTTAVTLTLTREGG